MLPLSNRGDSISQLRENSLHPPLHICPLFCRLHTHAASLARGRVRQCPNAPKHASEAFWRLAERHYAELTAALARATRAEWHVVVRCDVCEDCSLLPPILPAYCRCFPKENLPRYALSQQLRRPLSCLVHCHLSTEEKAAEVHSATFGVCFRGLL